MSEQDKVKKKKKNKKKKKEEEEQEEEEQEEQDVEGVEDVLEDFYNDAGVGKDLEPEDVPQQGGE